MTQLALVTRSISSIALHRQPRWLRWLRWLDLRHQHWNTRKDLLRLRLRLRIRMLLRLSIHQGRPSM